MNASPDSDSSWQNIPRVKVWRESLEANGCALESLQALNILRKRDGEPLFILAEARGKDPAGNPLMPYALLRGPACVVVPVCRNRTSGEKRFLMILQRRIGHGGLSLEFPAGMVDDDLSNPAGVAVRELEEETGLRVDVSRLETLWKGPLFSSPGLSDESIYFYTVEIDLDETEWKALEGAATGHAHEGEYITTTLKTFDEAMAGLNSIQPLTGLQLYRNRFGVPT